MHDAKGRELSVGDTVLVPFTIANLYASDEYCAARSGRRSSHAAHREASERR